MTMKLTVIGCYGGFPAAGEATSGYLFESNGFRLLVDCGSGVLSKLQQYIDIEELDAVLLSHYHHDHIADIGPLQYAKLVGYHLGKAAASFRSMDILVIKKHLDGFLMMYIQRQSLISQKKGFSLDHFKLIFENGSSGRMLCDENSGRGCCGRVYSRLKLSGGIYSF